MMNQDTKVMVFMCDGNLLDKVKPLIHNVKQQVNGMVILF